MTRGGGQKSDPALVGHGQGRPAALGAAVRSRVAVALAAVDLAR